MGKKKKKIATQVGTKDPWMTAELYDLDSREKLDERMKRTKKKENLGKLGDLEGLKKLLETPEKDA